MQTIGRRHPRDAPKGEYVSRCDYCGTLWHRSKLKKDGAGLYYCPQEGDGLDAVTLSKMVAARAKAGAASRIHRQPGPATSENPSLSSPGYSTGLGALALVGYAFDTTLRTLLLTFDRLVKAGGGGTVSVYARASAALIATYTQDDLDFSARTATLDVSADLPAPADTWYYVLASTGLVLDLSGASWAGIASATGLEFET